MNKINVFVKRMKLFACQVGKLLRHRSQNIINFVNETEGEKKSEALASDDQPLAASVNLHREPLNIVVPSRGRQPLALPRLVADLVLATHYLGVKIDGGEAAGRRGGSRRKVC
jgi:hypothetical protein